MHASERRRQPRTSFGAAATVTNGDRTLEGTLIDLSLAGVLFKARDPSTCLETGQLVTVRTHGVAGEIEMPGRIVHFCEYQFGVAFEHLSLQTRQSIYALLGNAQSGAGL